MPALFSPRANVIFRTIVLALVFLPLIAGATLYAWYQSPYRTKVGLPVPQPIPFSHAHHVGGIGIDCRYCHATAEESAFAGMPATDTCMNCHWQIWTEAPLLEPLRESWRTGIPIQWQRVHVLPDFVFFDHSVHVTSGIGCTTCHGQVDQMPLVWRSETLYMKWCLDCHRDPAAYIRPRSEVYSVEYQRPEDQSALGVRLLEEYDVQLAGLTDCTACHR